LGKTAATTRRRPAPSANGTAAPHLRTLTDLFKSLADEHRLRILFLLAEYGEMNVTAIGEQLGQSQPAVSHHLTQLRTAGLIEFRRDGKYNYYAINPTGLHDLLGRVAPAGGPVRVAVGGVEIAVKRK
jgi:ArsR family transcriptional regulator